MPGALGGGQSGSSSTTSTQPYIMSGPTLQAANSAAQAQFDAAKQASAAVTQNTTSAISALMSEYGTALQLQTPYINTGNQAEAQLNYMLGLPAVNPGTAPIAPTAPGQITPLDPGAFAKQIDSSGFYDGGGNKVTGLQNILNQPGNKGNGSIGAALSAMGIPINGPNNTPGNSINPTAEQLTALQQSNPELYKQFYAGVNSGDYAKLDAETQVYNQQKATYDQQMSAYNNQKSLYDSYTGKGIATPDTINNIVSNLPGFAYDQQQGIGTIQNAASAKGMLNSGNILQGLNEFGQKLSQTYYQNYLNNLSGMAGLGQQASTNASNGANTLGANIASAYTNQGAGQANAALAQGQAMASSYLLPVDNQKVVMTPYTTTSSTDSSSSGGGNVGGLLSGLSSVSSAGGFGKVLGGLL